MHRIFVYECSSDHLTLSFVNSGYVHNTAMDGIKESLDNFNSTVAKSILVHPERMCPDSSPERREKAVRLLELQGDYLSDNEMIAFFNYFKTNTATADIYLAITCESLRKGWVQ